VYRYLQVHVSIGIGVCLKKYKYAYIFFPCYLRIYTFVIIYSIIHHNIVWLKVDGIMGISYDEGNESVCIQVTNPFFTWMNLYVMLFYLGVGVGLLFWCCMCVFAETYTFLQGVRRIYIRMCVEYLVFIIFIEMCIV